VPASERRSWPLLVVALLAIVQGVLGLLRALDLVRVGADVVGRGVLLLPLIGSFIIARGVLIAGIALLYGMFAWGALRHAPWARPIGVVAALLNGLLVVATMVSGGGALATLAWGVVPVVILAYTLISARHRAF
jgi:hypothetical protein